MSLHQNSPDSTRAFSLVEVLIAVVVLAIGLLGLGMVFPVVVRQQRVAQDSIQGFSAAQSVATEILHRGDGRDTVQTIDFTGPGAPFFPDTLTIGWKNPLGSSGKTDVYLSSLEAAPALIREALETDKAGKAVFGKGNVSVALTTLIQNKLEIKRLSLTFSGDLLQRKIEPLAFSFVDTRNNKTSKGLLSGESGLLGALWDRAVVIDEKMPKNRHSQWFDPQIAQSNGYSTNPQTGQMVVGDGASGMTAVTIDVAQRLSPSPFTASNPQFVWDMWLRRSSETQMQVAIFTRRIDAGIRIPTARKATDTWTLTNVLTGRPSNSFPKESVRVPVAVDSQGRPTLTGADERGTPRYATFRLSVLKKIRPFAGQLPPTYLDFEDGLATSDPVAYQALRQPGQKLVDGFGGVNTVVKFDETQAAGRVRVLLEAPISQQLFDSIFLTPIGSGGGGSTGPQYVLYTPQVPAGVEVFTVER